MKKSYSPRLLRLSSPCQARLSPLPIPLRQPATALMSAYERIHGSGTQGELTLHDLRANNHCAH